MLTMLASMLLTLALMVVVAVPVLVMVPRLVMLDPVSGAVIWVAEPAWMRMLGRLATSGSSTLRSPLITRVPAVAMAPPSNLAVLLNAVVPAETVVVLLLVRLNVPLIVLVVV